MTNLGDRTTPQLSMIRAAGVGKGSAREVGEYSPSRKSVEITTTEAIKISGGTRPLAEKLAALNPDVEVRSIQRALQRQAKAESEGIDRPSKYRIWASTAAARAKPTTEIGAIVTIGGDLRGSGEGARDRTLPPIYLTAAQMRSILAEKNPDRAADALYRAALAAYGAGSKASPAITPDGDRGRTLIGDSAGSITTWEIRPEVTE